MRRAGLTILRVTILAAAILASWQVAAAPVRVALLIGNAAYRAAGPVTTAVADVALLASAFEAAGFASVVTVKDADRSGMDAALAAFAAKARTADIAVIYFSGHGFVFDDENYLLAIDAHGAVESEVAAGGVSFHAMLAATAGARQLRLVILDASREDPYLDHIQIDHVRTMRSGLGRIEVEEAGEAVATAARAGEVAPAGKGPHGLFAEALAAHLVQRGVDYLAGLNEAGRDVRRRSQGRQEPSFTASAVAQVFLGPP
ncbi:caspase family protein [Labrys wisconsinensis]|uniref:Caspase-like protein n=1 Tax=Labrys wisconsinensis TaxID=425677 RepID=A0ABU0JJV1_9HYPH|nr:caspase family protein [Labrys wisconsinensis]MDQ0473880.1 putative caspase-like protein [Labrys wisconsinensis]